MMAGLRPSRFASSSTLRRIWSCTRWSMTLIGRLKIMIVGALDQRARHIELLALRRGEPPAAGADIEVEADAEHVVIEAELVEQVADDGADALRPVGMLVADAAEQHVVHEARGRRVVLGIVALDRALRSSGRPS